MPALRNLTGQTFKRLTVPESSPFHDAAAPILAGDSNLNDGIRSQAWDIFHQSPDARAFAQKIAGLDICNETKHQLFQAKQSTDQVPSHADKIVDVITRMAAMDKSVIDTVEKYPNVLRAITQTGKG